MLISNKNTIFYVSIHIVDGHAPRIAAARGFGQALHLVDLLLLALNRGVRLAGTVVVLQLFLGQSVVYAGAFLSSRWLKYVISSIIFQVLGVY